jgi:flagellar export protein FliJ
MPAKPRYRLKTVLDLRQRAKQDAARLLARRREELAAAQTELARRQQAVENCLAEQAKQHQLLLEKMSGGMEAKQALVYRTHLADLREHERELRLAVAQQQIAVQKAEEEVEKAITGLIKATQEAQVIEKHKESWQEKNKVEEGRREQKLSDEIGAILYEKKR